MDCRTLALLWFCLSGTLPLSQGQTDLAGPRKAPPIVPAMQAPVQITGLATLADGTEVMLRLAASVKIKEAKVGNTVPFVLYHDLHYRNVLLAKAGQSVEAQVVDAAKARWATRGSKLAIEMTGIKLLNGQTLPLRGYSVQRGGSGNSVRVADSTIEATSDLVCGGCGNVFAPAALAFFLAPGSNRDMKEDTGSPAYVNGNVVLDLESFRPFQAKEDSAQAMIHIVRGHYGWPYSRDLYCNGIPLVHLNADHKLEFTLNPGYYRFAINPKKTPLQIYVPPGTDTKLITTYDEIAEMREQDRSLNSGGVRISPLAKAKSEGDLLKHAKPVDRADIYSTDCSPLPEQLEANPPAPASPRQ
jgi:hypothetical protein